MSWVMVGVAAVAVVGSVVQSKNANKQADAQASAQNTANYKSYTNNVNQIMENNEAIGEANTTNMIRAGYKVGILNLQTARLKEQAAQDGYLVSQKAADALSNATANAAASGTVGASVNAVANDITKKSGEAQIAVDQNWQDAAENQNIELKGLTDNAIDNLQSAQNIPDLSSVGTVTPIKQNVWTNALIAGGTSLASSYASGKMNLGAQTVNSPTVDSSSSYAYSSILSGPTSYNSASSQFRRTQ